MVCVVVVCVCFLTSFFSKIFPYPSYMQLSLVLMIFTILLISSPSRLVFTYAWCIFSSMLFLKLVTFALYNKLPFHSYLILSHILGVSQFLTLPCANICGIDLKAASIGKWISDKARSRDIEVRYDCAKFFRNKNIVQCT